MRPIERIEPFLEKVKIRYVIRYIFKLHNYVDPTKIKETFDERKKEVKEFWLQNSDLRFSQVLVSLEYIPNIPGAWYYMEEDEILEKLGYPLEEILLWGTNYDKDMNRLPNTIWKPINELESDHLRAIINGGFVKYNKKYRQIMCKVLRNRGERL